MTDYHSRPELSSSQLALFLRDPIVFYHTCVLGDWPKDEPTPAMQFGTLVHTMIELGGPDRLDIVRRPEGLDLRTKEGKAWREANAGKEIVSEPDWLRLERVWTHLQACSQVRKFLGNGHVERELFWQHSRSGIDCRAKVDQLSDGVLIDWKTTSAASEEEFINQAVNMHYDIRLAFYRDGIETVENIQRPKILVVGIQSGGGHEIFPLEITGLMEELHSEERMHRAVEDISTFVLEEYLDRPIKVATAPPWLVRKYAGELTEVTL
jgi:exodeoxyribonuclease VIII